MDISTTIVHIPALTAAQVNMYLDGVPLSFGLSVLSVPAGRIGLVHAASQLYNGVHTVRVTANDGVDASQTSWSFTVGIPPTLTSPTPADGAAITSGRPPIGITVAANTPGQVAVKMTVDGTAVLNGSYPQGDVRWTPAVDFTNGSFHAVSVVATDSTGRSTTRSWSFTAVAAPPMSDAGNCAECHSGFPTPGHVMTNCLGCHSIGSDPTGNHANSGGDPNYVVGDPAPAGPCYGCHNSWVDHIALIRTYRCADCHSAAWPSVPMHTDAKVASSHVTSTNMSGCSCHGASLITEHGKFPTNSVFKHQCSTCHQSIDPLVVAAIATGKTNCDACHSTLDHTTIHITAAPAVACQASGCHPGATLLDVHGKLVCADCHASTNSVVTSAIAAGDKKCATCHPDANHATIHITAAPVVACQASGCHPGATLVDVHTLVACAGCHESTDPIVTAAISGGDKKCATCHPNGGAHAAVHEGGFESTDDPTTSCSICHSSNVSTQHDGNCDLCHKSTDPNVVAAIAAGDTACSGCHSTMHGATLDYYDFQAGDGVVTGAEFQKVFPTSWNASFAIDNGSEASGTATPHSGYSQSTAKCAVCHAVHRAPTLGTAANATIDNGGKATTSARYKGAAWTAEASTQMLLRSSAARACIYCHVTETPSGKMYGGDTTLAIVGDTDFGWGAFYAHTTGCTGCHAVHGANTMKSADGTVDSLILKYQGVKNLGTIALRIQPEVYGSDGVADKPANYGSLYTSFANMKTGRLSPTAIAAGVTPKAAAITAQCTICHAQYAVGEETINANYTNATLFQPATWASANGSTAKIWVGNAADPVSSLPSYASTAGITYNTGAHTAMTGSAGSLIMAYKNHPLKAGGQDFKGAGASAFFVSGSVHVSETGSSVCQSCHNAPEATAVGSSDGAYEIQSFPHYTPGYYKFMAAQDQTAFSTPVTLADFTGGRMAFFSNPAHNKPAVMNDGYCTKCHNTVGTNY